MEKENPRPYIRKLCCLVASISPVSESKWLSCPICGDKSCHACHEMEAETSTCQSCGVSFNDMGNP
jgi:hypothetical protein